MEKLYEGKAKILYQTDDPDILLTYYKDDATAFNAQKRGQIVGKGEINCTVSTALFQWLESLGIPTHYIDRPSSREMRVKAIKIIPLEVVVRNIAAGSLCKQTGLKEGKVLPFPLVEFYLKDDALGDPLLTPDRIKVIDIASESFESGKTPGTDLREGVPTLVTLNVMKSQDPADSELRHLLSAPIEDEATVAQVLRELRQHKALEESRSQLVSIAKEARAALGPLPVGEPTGALLSLCDAVIDRTA